MTFFRARGVRVSYFDGFRISTGNITAGLNKSRFSSSSGNLLDQIPGVRGVYFVAGEYDFVVVCESFHRENYLEKLEMMYEIEGFERANTIAVMKSIKEISH